MDSDFAQVSNDKMNEQIDYKGLEVCQTEFSQD